MIHFHGISLGLFFSSAFVQGGEPHFSLIYKVSDSALFISTALSIVAPTERALVAASRELRGWAGCFGT